MKKKILSFVIVLMLIALSLVTLIACKDNSIEVVYGKKYILSDDVNEEADKQRYYVIKDDGTMIYRYYKIYNEKTDETQIIDYILQYRYTFVDSDKSSIVCFYDSLIDSSVYIDKDGKTFPLKDYYIGYNYLPDKDASELIIVSKNVLCIAGTGYTFYINEDYVKNIPNFNKTTETEK